ncbi:MAG: hypothetical protein GTO43_05575, partial [Armatimonadetes bacterium]|nr:hypothetical protein [Armatimonadota bacterium]
RLRRIALPARRGVICDRNGKKLVVNAEAYDIAVRPVKIADKAGTAERLAPVVGWDTQDLLALLNSGKKFVYLKRGCDVSVGRKVEELELPGVEALKTVARVYPVGLAAHVVGFT